MPHPPRPDRPTARRRALGATLLLAALATGLAAPPARAGKDDAKVKALPAKYQQWLEEVELIISKEERALFLELAKDYQRDAFIERFWKVRDPYPRTARNEFKESWDARVREVKESFGSMDDERSRILLIQGFPEQRLPIDCAPYVWPVEVWYYAGSEQLGFEFLLLFYQKWGAGPYRLWEPFDGNDLFREPGVDYTNVDDKCGGDKGRAIQAALGYMLSQGGQLGATTLLARLRTPPAAPGGEWVATFSTYSTDLPEGAQTFDADLDVAFPGRHQSRTVVQGTVTIPTAQLGKADLAGHGSYNLMLGGEILQDGALFENFRYKFDLPEAEVRGDKVPLVFQRYLRPGSYRLVLLVEDVDGGRFHRVERDLEVPKVETTEPPAPQDPETARLLAEANAAIRSGESTIKILPLTGEWQTGLVRIDTLTTGDDIAAATFFLDGRPVLTKKTPPYSVELDLGNVPRSRIIRVVGKNAAGEEVANDEQMLNAGPHRFAVRLVEPQRGKSYHTSLRAQAEVQVPEGEAVGRVEFYLNETLVATVYQPPYIQPILLPSDSQIAYVRAVAYTPDGDSTEDLAFINAPDYLEEVNVDFVELYVTVLDRDHRPVQDLPREDFTVVEDGVEQSLLRFDQVRDLPIHVGVMIDVSASMEERLGAAQTAALGFLEDAIQPQDRAAIVTFNDHPNLAAKLTNDRELLAGGLAGLKAERGTALYDSLIFTLYYFNGIKGQRAILLLSDGKDESSRFTFDETLEFAHRAGVAIYTIGLDLPRSDFEVRKKLSKLANETGGRSFYIDDAAELGAIYDAIEQELRSRYLLAYQSSNTSQSDSFRTVEVKLARSGLEAKTARGYYP